jgi:hypothetical protein
MSLSYKALHTNTSEIKIPKNKMKNPNVVTGDIYIYIYIKNKIKKTLPFPAWPFHRDLQTCSLSENGALKNHGRRRFHVAEPPELVVCEDDQRRLIVA